MGYPTFGIGHLIRRSDPENGKPVGTPVSKSRVDAVFAQDLANHAKWCRDLFPSLDSYPTKVQRVLVNMTFNLGKAGLASFRTFGDAIKRKDWKYAAKRGRATLWYRQVTNRAERLMRMLESV